MKVFLISLFGCKQTNSLDKNLDAANDKLSNASSISYTYRSITDNRFNETRYEDSAKITYYKVDSRYFGFGFHAFSRNEEYVFDGFSFEKIKHTEKERVEYNRDDIKRDSSYFSGLSFFATNPMEIQNYYEFDTIFTALENQKNYKLFRTEEKNKSKSDDTKIVKYQKSFYVETGSNNIEKVQNLVIRNDETLQIINHYFSEYSYNNLSSNFPALESKAVLNYRTIREEDEYEEFTYTPIKKNEILPRKSYIDVKEDGLKIYGENQKVTMIMFSFIGCAPCENALKDFFDSEYWFKDHINIFYSSFQNNSSTLKKYLDKKGFPFRAFGKESNMIKDFSLYHSPSFVFIDPNGKILKVVEGYDEEIKKTLFDLIQLKK